MDQHNLQNLVRPASVLTDWATAWMFFNTALSTALHYSVTHLTLVWIAPSTVG